MTFAEAFHPIRALKSTFETMNLQPAQLWGGGILLAFLDVCTGGGQNGQHAKNLGMDVEVSLVVMCVGCVVGLLGFVASCWVRPGVFHNLKSVLRTSEIDSRGIFDHRDQFVPLLLARLLKGVILVASLLIILVPMIGVLILSLLLGGDIGGVMFILVSTMMVLVGFPAFVFVYCGLVFTEEFVVFGDAPPVDALSQSWKLAKGNRWSIILFGIVTFFFILLGLLLCCIGVFATAAVSTLAWGEAYLQLTTGDEMGATVDEGPLE